MDEKFVDEVRKAMDRINSNGGVIASDYSRHIFDAIAEDVAEDVAVTADTGTTTTTSGWPSVAYL